MRVELVVLDMAGTTVFDGDAVHGCLAAAMRAIARQDVTREACNGVMGIPKRVAIRTLLREPIAARRPDPSDALVEQIYRDFEGRMLDYYRTDAEVREVPGAAEVFGKLHERGIRVALDTGFNRPVADAVIRRLKWDQGGLLDTTVTSDEVAAGRPAPYLIYRAMERTGVIDVGRVVKVGDTPSDLNEGANARCGMVVGVTSGSHTREELARHPHDALIESIRDLPALLDRPRSAAAPASEPQESTAGAKRDTICAM